jgi:hypothetical protein
MTENEANYLVQRRTWFQFALRQRIAAVGGAEIKDERVDSFRAVIADIDEQLSADVPPRSGGDPGSRG